MAKKKRRLDGERPKRPADLPGRRSMEGMMRQLVAGLQGHADQDTPLAQAHEILLHAYQNRNSLCP